MTQPQFSIQVDTQGLQEAIRATQKLKGPFTGIVINDGLREIGRTFVPSKGTGPLANATPKDKTKRLSRSTFFELLTSRLAGFGIKEQALVIKQPARTAPEYGSEDYGKFVRGGTKAHEIRARLKQVLRFEIGGTVFFATKVNHPGNKPNTYHIRTAQNLRLQVQSIVNRMTKRLVDQYRR